MIENKKTQEKYQNNNTKNKLYKLKPSTKDYIWGGDTLKTKYGKESESDVLAESWELSCHPDGPSMLESEGVSLAQYIEQNPTALGSTCEKFDEFPMLVKFIDAKSALSIQVHPDDAYSKEYEGQLGKTEMWYVVDAKPEAFLYYGFKEEVSKEIFEAAIANDTLCDLLNKVEVKAGDMFFIEAGTIHAIGAGIVIAEIQQSSNVTYRVYDYGRLGLDGQPRELHVKKACDVTACVQPKTDYDFGTHLGHCEYFTVDKYELDGLEVIVVDDTSFVSFLCLEGDGIVECDENSVNISAGDSIFAPASTGKCTVKGKGTILVTYIK